MLYLICYDITANKTRKIIHDTLLCYGEKINLSVFELSIKESKMQKLIKDFSILINPKTDTIKIYPLKPLHLAKTLGKELSSEYYI